MLFQFLLEDGQTVVEELLGVLGAQSITFVQVDLQGGPDVLLPVLQERLLLLGQTLLQHRDGAG